MLYVVSNSGLERTWHLGKDKPNISASSVAEIQADGHELGAILEQLDNLPKHKSSPVQHWFGDHAKFIWANLK